MQRDQHPVILCAPCSLHLHRSRQALHLTKWQKQMHCNFCLRSSNFRVCCFEALHFSGVKMDKDGWICHMYIANVCNHQVIDAWRPLFCHVVCLLWKSNTLPKHFDMSSLLVNRLRQSEQNQFWRLFPPISIIPLVIDGELLLHVCSSLFRLCTKRYRQ